jgi:hypothetical protein
MAKAKKDSGAKSEGAKKTAKKPAKQAEASSSGIFVDTNLAAESAARLLAAGVSTKAPADAQPHTESSLFKQMKSGLANPAAQSMSNLLDKHGDPTQKKSAAPFAKGPQMGRNQTFGADVNRAGVPRRTGGG